MIDRTKPPEARYEPAPTELDGSAAVVAAQAVLAGGGICLVRDVDQLAHVRAVDGMTADELDRHVRMAGGNASLVITGPRAQTLGLAVPVTRCVSLQLPADIDLNLLRSLADIFVGSAADALARGVLVTRAREAERAAIELAKRAGLLPVVLVLGEAEIVPDIAVSAEEIFAERAREIASLQPVVETRLPIAATENARLVAFRPAAGGSEQVALLIGRPEDVSAPLCRLHSECLTGDLFGSLRCDCGEQLNGAIARMAEEGAGVLLYLRQEGRGIGLVNKLRAYRLQDSGMDTVDANTHLGFQPDERDFAIAATMLQRLGLGRVRLLTNNPDKLAALTRHGVDVVERVPLSFAANRHNRFYLETKARKSGHLLRVIDGGRQHGRGELHDPLGRAFDKAAGHEFGS